MTLIFVDYTSLSPKIYFNESNVNESFEVNSFKNYGYKLPLNFACELGQIELCKLFINLKASVNIEDTFCNKDTSAPPLFKVIRGMDPLISKSWINAYEICKLLLENRADVSYTHNDHSTALIDLLDCRFFNTPYTMTKKEIIKILLKYKTFPNDKIPSCLILFRQGTLFCVGMLINKINRNIIRIKRRQYKGKYYGLFPPVLKIIMWYL